MHTCMHGALTQPGGHDRSGEPPYWLAMPTSETRNVSSSCGLPVAQSLPLQSLQLCLTRFCCTLLSCVALILTYVLHLWHSCLHAGRVPWGHLPHQYAIIAEVVSFNRRPAWNLTPGTARGRGSSTPPTPTTSSSPAPAESTVPMEIQRLVEACWAVDPTARPTSSDLVGILGGLVRKYCMQAHAAGMRSRTLQEGPNVKPGVLPHARSK